MNMKTNYLKLNSWAVAALMGMCSLAACSDDNSGEGGGNGDSEEVIANNGLRVNISEKEQESKIRRERR